MLTFSHPCAATNHSGSAGAHRESAKRLRSDLVNIRSITRHFVPIIESQTKDAGQVLTIEQVLGVVRAHYASLTLKLQEGLDRSEPYEEAVVDSDNCRELAQLAVADLRDELQRTPFPKRARARTLVT